MTNQPFWHKPLDELTPAEWEALCDGCGKCCLIKLHDDDTGEVHDTDVCCRLLDPQSCRCGNYAHRRTLVEGCMILTPRSLRNNLHWIPATCAYRLRLEGKPLPDWHYLISGDRDTVHRAGQSVQGKVVPEYEVPEDELEDHIIPRA